MTAIHESYEQGALREANAANNVGGDCGYATVLALLAVVAELRRLGEEIRGFSRDVAKLEVWK